MMRWFRAGRFSGSQVGGDWERERSKEARGKRVENKLIEGRRWEITVAKCEERRAIVKEMSLSRFQAH
jgi:hypothetical protein